MKILYFGTYDPNYSRNRVLMSGLRDNGVEILECNSREAGLKKYWSLYRQHKKLRYSYDILFVGFSGHSVVWFAKLLTKKKIVFDAFVSQYLSNIVDRGLYSPKSLFALYYWLLDKISCSLADIILLDTNAQINYFIKTFKLPPLKFKRIFVGSDLAGARSRVQDTIKGKFIVHWHGYIVPFDGINVILEAAGLLKNEPGIFFRIITRLDSKARRLQKLITLKSLSNIEIIGEVSSRELVTYLDASDICLGVFGDNEKASLVIPNKIYEAVTRGRPVITGAQQVLSELFEEGVGLITVEPNNATALANKLLECYGNSERCKEIGQQGLEVYDKELTPRILGKQLLLIIKEIL